MSLGMLIRESRSKVNLSLRAMEKQTKISAAKLSKVENGKATLKYAELLAVSECLNIPIVALMSGELSAFRPSGCRSITRAGGEHRFAKANKVYHVLCGAVTRCDNRYWRVVVRDIAPGSAQSYASHPGEEFIYVLKGTLELRTELYEPLILKTGEAVLFDPGTPHAYFSSKGPEVEILVVNSVPHGPAPLERKR